MDLYHYHPPGTENNESPSFSGIVPGATLFSSNAHFDGLFLMVDLFGLDYPATLEGWTRNRLRMLQESDWRFFQVIEWALLVRQLGLSKETRTRMAVDARRLKTKPTWWYGTPLDLSGAKGMSTCGFFTAERYDGETSTWVEV